MVLSGQRMMASLTLMLTWLMRTAELLPRKVGGLVYGNGLGIAFIFKVELAAFAFVESFFNHANQMQVASG